MEAMIYFFALWAVIYIGFCSIKDEWKKWCFLLLAAVFILFLRIAEHDEGYAEGVHDTTCAIWSGLADESPTNSIPDYC